MLKLIKIIVVKIFISRKVLYHVFVFLFRIYHRDAPDDMISSRSYMHMIHMNMKSVKENYPPFEGSKFAESVKVVLQNPNFKRN